MKAAQINGYGHAGVVRVIETEKPTASEEQVLVKVEAASLNPFDTSLREGYMQKMIPLQFPATLGGDIVGTVTAVGAGVSQFAAGDKVFGQANVVAGNSGAFAEFAATAAGQVAKAPAKLKATEAAATPLVGVSALQALTEHIKLTAGQKLLIHGGGGSIGAVAVQLAKQLGARVAATATGSDIEYVKSLGADEVIDYKSQDFTKLVSDYDAVFDTVGGAVFEQSFAVLRPGGIAVTMIAQFDEAKAQEHGIAALMQGTKVTTAALDKLRQFIEDGTMNVRVDSSFPLNQIQQAFEKRESGSAHGKIVIAML
ncbi:MAG TPA: NADP-dependent oxidoreductase [Candidatus Saccharimonadales bacterium]|nr:NADP-dependent oxidoreductase [Candidatus Saccharimonadales bacterium]